MPLAAVALLSGCGGSSDGGYSNGAKSTETTTQANFTATPVNVHKLPLGDDMYEESGPRKGYVYSCISDFNGSGAFEQGPWIDANAGTWDLTEKIYVQGKVDWDSEFNQSVSGGERNLKGNGLPPQPSGEFPVSSSDPAYSYDRNPNSISSYELKAALPANPKRAGKASCVGGTVGVMKNGVPLFSAFDAGGRDAVATEIQDRCDAHPEKTGQYHYHGLSSCLYQQKNAAQSELLGWALDGFGIYAERDSEGNDALQRRPRFLPRAHQLRRVERRDAAHLPLRRHAGLPVHGLLLQRHRDHRSRRPRDRCSRSRTARGRGAPRRPTRHLRAAATQPALNRTCGTIDG